MTARIPNHLSRIWILFLLFVVAVFFASHVFAQDLPSGRQDATPDANSTRKPFIPQGVETRKDIMQDKMADFKAKMASREAALKAKLDAFRDKRKAEIAARVNTNLNKINQNQTDQMLKFLSKATEILNKLENRVNQGTPDIKDPVAARSAIADARVKIASAEAAVRAQAQNDYSIQVTTEAGVKKDAQSAREKLHADLLAVRKLVIDAKQAVADAIRVAKSGKIETKEATSSGK